MKSAMHPIASCFCLLAASIALSGCIARAAANIVTAPVRITGKAVDMATTSQSEADEKRGRAMRKHEERLGKLQRSYEDNRRACDRGNAKACEKARADYAGMRELGTSGY
jgi:hypothetical protein